MRHIAVLSPRLRFLRKIIAGEKIIESRWMKTRRAPWDRVTVGDRIFFKEGPLVTHAADVARVLQFTDLDEEKRRVVLDKYGKQLGMDASNRSSFDTLTGGKRYAVLMFLVNVRPVAEPFAVNKKGYGAMAGWIVL